MMWNDSPFVMGESIPESIVDNAGYWLLRSDVIYGKQDNVIGVGSASSSVDKLGGALSAADAEMIDKKIDDGFSATGQLYIGRGYDEGSNRCTNKAVTSSPPVELLQRDQNPTCALYFWLTDIDS